MATDATGSTDRPADRPQAGPSPALRGAAAWCLAVLVVALFVAAMVALAVFLRAVTGPLAIAVLASALFYPLHRRLLRLGLRRGVAAGLTCAALVTLGGATLWLVVALVSDNAAKFAAALGDAADRLRDRFGWGGDPAAQASDGLHELGGKLGGELASGVVSGVGAATQVVLGGVLALAFTFFLLRDGHRLPALVRRFTPESRRALAEALTRRSFLAVSGFMRGTTIIALIDATFIAIGLAVLGVPGAAGLAALVFVGAYIPYVGAFLSGTVAVLVAFADGGLGTALGALGVVLGVQFVEGMFLQPIVQSRTVALHPAVVMGSVIGGGAVAGVFGALLAVPVAAVLASVVVLLRGEGDGVDPPGG
ncbi:AI-2E family transporter [Yinghuangia seranimata]|uniref:AI-2E family transporter n=1 Tax=Yinghuangia seranimata TaxID=408067 RepID=UPI00248BF7E0|nr:AI-2E family transporter [Yinghuangia seranimata]MDI2127675.1 AI-2E family transporter [Yinghuangia seranimata]